MSDQNRIEWEGKHFSCFTNRACEYFPCHEGVEPGSFNCLFCYCPLYALGTACGGNFVMLENGVKDCSGCAVPHRQENYGYITEQFEKIRRLMEEKK